MEKLFVETNEGRIPIDDGIVEKYNLKEGTYTPYNHERIVDKDGNFIREIENRKNKREELKNQDDNIEEMENGFMISTSEMIDLAEGADSYPDENQDE